MTAGPRRVLVLINGVDDTFGGNLRAAVNIAEAMAGDGTAVTFSAPVVRGQDHRTVDLMDPRVDQQLFVASRPVARFGGSIRQLWWLWRALPTFDEVQTHSLFSLSAVYSIVLSSVRRVPVLLWPHGSIDPFDLRKHARVKKLLAPATRWLIDRCAALLFTTAHESSIAVTYGSATPREVVALPVAPLPVSHGSDATTWRRRHGVPLEAPVVLFLGRIDYKKRLPLLVEAVSLLQHRDAQLVVVGDGPEAERALVAETAQRCDVTDRMHITGWLEGDDRLEAFAAGDVFALLSDAENFGLSIIEAMSTGCPVVISDQIDLAEELERAGAAIRVERDAAAAAQAIDRLLDDPAEAAAMGERAKDLVAREFAPSVVAGRLREVAERRAVRSRPKVGREKGKP